MLSAQVQAKTLLEQCDFNGNWVVDTRKTMKTLWTPRDEAKKEARCKTDYDIAQWEARIAQWEARIAQLEIELLEKSIKLRNMVANKFEWNTKSNNNGNDNSSQKKDTQGKSSHEHR